MNSFLIMRFLYLILTIIVKSVRIQNCLTWSKKKKKMESGFFFQIVCLKLNFIIAYVLFLKKKKNKGIQVKHVKQSNF